MVPPGLHRPGGRRVHQRLRGRVTPPVRSYTLEVSSAGADRVLKKPEHFARFRGEPVDVRLYRAREGRKELTGTLKGYDDGDVTVELDGTDTLLEKKDVAQVRLHVTF